MMNQSAKKLAFAAFAVVLGLGIWALASNWVLKSDSKSSAIKLKSAPHFELPKRDGTLFRLQATQGKVIVLHFWATWCAPCLEELPNFVELARKHENQAILWVAVSLDKNWQKANEFLKPDMIPPNLVSVLDVESKVPELYGSFQFPETYLIAPDLRILSKWVGPQDWESKEMGNLFEQVAKAISKNK